LEKAIKRQERKGKMKMEGNKVRETSGNGRIEETKREKKNRKRQKETD
jgi:hypothetical protein